MKRVRARVQLATAVSAPLLLLSRRLLFGWTIANLLLLISSEALFGQEMEPMQEMQRETEENDAGLELFEKKIRPVLAQNCYACHSRDAERNRKLRGFLRLDTREGIRQGGDSGPAVVPRDVEKSALISALRQETFAMPPSGKLPDDVIEDFVRWIEMGAPDPREAEQEIAPGAAPILAPNKIDLVEARKFWSFQPPQPIAVPPVQNTAWPRSEFDRFILATLEAKRLQPAAEADRRTWLRRVTFDLVGLPPTPEETNAFLADQSPDAFEQVVDRLLASQHYGERWGRHWLDVVRYTDSPSAIFTPAAGALDDLWIYRDWVIDAFNRDLPYNDFVAHQIAGDLLGGENDSLRSTAATGMLLLGNITQNLSERFAADVADDQVDVVMRGFLGLTVSCARCHDHKFDPISTADYYALAGIFFSSHPNRKVLWNQQIELEKFQQLKQEYQAKIETVQAKQESFLNKLDQQFLEQLTARVDDYVMAAWEWHRGSSQSSAPSVVDIADKHELYAPILDSWLRVLGWGARRRPEFGAPQRKAGIPEGLHVWKEDGRRVAVNLSDAPATTERQTIPAHGVQIEPTRQAGVAVVWRSPISGTVSIRGSLATDPESASSTVWRLYHYKKVGTESLATGVATGEPQNSAIRSKKLQRLSVAAGDEIELVLLPGGTATLVDLTVEEIDGQKQLWNLSKGLASLAERQEKRLPADIWFLGGLAELFPPIPLPRGSVLDDLARQLQAGPLTPEAEDEAVQKESINIHKVFSSACRQKINISGEQTPDVWLAQVVTALTVSCASSDRQALTNLPQHRIAFFMQPVGRCKELVQTTRRSHRRSLDQLYANNALAEASKKTSAKAAMKIRAFRKQLADLHNHSSALEPPKPAPCCSEGGLAGSRYADKTQDVAIHIGGHHDQLGPIVPRRFPLVLAGENQPPIAEGSGRRELAAWISSPENPLVARVMVNRLWLHHFGQGLVRTPDNFGRYGQRPTHPELLDYLALRLIEHGWSLKRLHREMVLSATYRQSSAASVATLEKDPENLLLGRANRLRLDAEQLRDSLLLVAGQLDRTPSGRPFPELATPRRTVYWQTPRVSAFNVATDPYRSIFDGANASIMVHQRNVSTTPLQALFLLNHPFASEQSRHLAIRVLKEQETDYQRIQWVYQLLYNRPAEPQELALGRKFLAQETGQEPEERSWQRYCQVLLCANEFVYLD